MHELHSRNPVNARTLKIYSAFCHTEGRREREREKERERARGKYSHRKTSGHAHYRFTTQITVICITQKNISGLLVFAVLYLLATFFFLFFFFYFASALVQARSRWWRRQICIRAVRLNRAISRALHRNNTDRGERETNYSIKYLWLRDIIAVLPPESTQMRYFMRHCADQTIQSM